MISQVQEFINWLLKQVTWWIIIMPWEKGIRVRYGKRITILEKGTYWKFPIIDSIYVQTIRERVAQLPIQTLTTLDGKTITIQSCIGYSIKDIFKIYNNIYNVEGTLSNITLGHIANYVATHNVVDCSPNEIGKETTKALVSNNYGLEKISVNIVSYAIVRTYRLIQDMSGWLPDRGSLDQKAQ